MPHLSFSQIQTWMGCSRQWSYGRVERQPSGWQAALGQCVHHALEVALKEVTEGKPLMPLSDLQHLFRLNWEIKRKEGGIKWFGVAQGAVSIRGEMMLAGAYDYLPLIIPKAADCLEKKIEYPIDVPGWSIVAVLDAITESNKVVDYKTTGEPWTQAKVDSHLQVEAYYDAFQAVYGHPPEAMTFLVMCSPKHGRPDDPALVQVLQTTRTPAQVNLYRQIANGVARAIDAGAVIPNPKFEYHKYCPWADACEMGVLASDLKNWRKGLGPGETVNLETGEILTPAPAAGLENQ